MKDIKQLQQENFKTSLEKQILQELFDDFKSEIETLEKKVNELYSDIFERENQINQQKSEIFLT